MDQKPDLGRALRRLLKFLHTMGAAGLIGSMACLLVLSRVAPPPSSLAGYAQAQAAMAEIARWIFMPSLGLTLIAGLIAIGVNRAFHNAGWAWIKLATGIITFEGSLIYIQGPIQEEASRAAEALAGQGDPTTLALAYGAEPNSIWALMLVAIANVVLGVWRPRLTRVRAEAAAVRGRDGEAAR